MHYIPESTCEMLRGDPMATGSPEGTRFHYRSAPLYALTSLVAVLLVADALVLFSPGPGGGLWPTGWPRDVLGYRFALLAAVLGGARILYHALDGLFAGRIGADLALTAACLAAIVLGEHQTAGLVVLISLIGESLEGYTIDRARWAVRQSFALQPPVAHLVHEGHERDVPIAEVGVGDFVVVRPGERIPADGRVVSGRSTVDASAFTGESLPQGKEAGDSVHAGTLNLDGAVTIVVEQVGRHTALARVADLVGSAAARKTHVERVVDRLARGFLPAVLLAALATWVGWRIATGSWRSGLIPALGVLVVACPCPLILATPAAVMAALAWLTRRGVLVRGSQALERLAHVDTFAFDKTGTLTQGALQLSEIVPTGELGADEILRLAASAERQSEHPLARLLVAAADGKNLSLLVPEQFQSFPGAGVVCRLRLPGRDQGVATQAVSVGNRRMLDRGEIAFHADAAALLRAREATGESALVVAVDEQIVGVIGVRETLRTESEHVLRELQQHGISQFALLTGDRPQPADAVVRALGLLDFVGTELLPADKAQWIEEARRSGRCVAMVGDGINDAPALAAADVGIALGKAGADLTAEAGDVILMGDPLRSLPGLVRLSRALVHNIWQSILLFAFGVNGLGVLACAFGWLTPVGAALFHELASLAVMANAMRLLWFEGRADSWAVRSQQGTLAFAEWLAVVASPSQWTYWLLDRWRLVTKLAACGLIAGWLLTGVVVIPADEQALVTRFGRLHETLPPGIVWRWPWPLEQVFREPVGRIHTVGIGFRDARSSGAMPPASPGAASSETWKNTSGRESQPGIQEWTSLHDDREELTEEALVLTADEVPVELTAAVEYRVTDLAQFRFGGTRQPEALIRAVAESVLRELAAQASLDALLTDQRSVLERSALRRVQDRIGSYRLGVEIVDLQWLDVHPPKPVVPAYRQVADALEERDLLVNDAQAYADRVLLNAMGEFARGRLAPLLGADDPRQTQEWQFDSRAWAELVAEQEQDAPGLSGTAAAVLNEARVAASQRIAAAEGAAGRWNRLWPEYVQSPTLTRQHLYWAAIARALAGKSLTILDPSAVGRRQVWLGDVPGPPVSPIPDPPAGNGSKAMPDPME